MGVPLLPLYLVLKLQLVSNLPAINNSKTNQTIYAVQSNMYNLTVGS